MYRQTFLGLFWAFLPPIANTAVWIFLRQQGVFDTGEMTVNATLYILTGMILWQSFSDAVQMPLKVLTQNKGMISKLRFSREALVMLGLGEVLFVLGAVVCSGDDFVDGVVGGRDRSAVDADRFFVSGCGAVSQTGDSVLDDHYAHYLCGARFVPRKPVGVVESGQSTAAVQSRSDFGRW